MANARNKTVDTTYLSVDTAERRGFLHRDYIAHCLRWSHVIKRLTERKAYSDARLLDVGCGRELPLAKTLYSSRLIVKQYFGIDAGPIEDEAIAVFRSGAFPIQAWEKCDILDITLDDLGGEQANWVTCFEVLEHVEPAHMLKMLSHIRSLMSPTGTAFFSTPCWDVVSCAANHVNEMKYHALGAIFEKNGWTINAVHGTFASQRDYVHRLSPIEKTLFDKLSDYYDSNVLACIFAPLYPDGSRNCLWELSPVPTTPGEERFKPIFSVPEPWGSSANWRDMALFDGVSQ
jgi:2-polyprenyl-3-methyl-5-hydroxy-6-metoxy-1,4-benzoquinol methylase